MIVVDSSVWIAAFRDQASAEAERLGVLLDSDVPVVAMVSPVRIELINGTPRRYLAAMRRWLSALPLLVPGDSCWKRAEEWASKAGTEGERFGVADLIIGATAAEHNADVWSLDGDFARMKKLGFVELYTLSNG